VTISITSRPLVHKNIAENNHMGKAIDRIVLNLAFRLRGSNLRVKNQSIVIEMTAMIIDILID